MIYGKFDADGFPLGFFDSRLHGENIPEDAVEITEAQWLQFINNVGYRRWFDGDVAEYLPPVDHPTEADVDRERDRRIADGFTFNGVFYQSRRADRENIAGAATAALAAITINGAQPGDYRWHGGERDFTWIAADNTTHPLDAQSTFAMGQAAMAHKEAHIFAARALKDQAVIPEDFASNPSYWP